MTVDQIAVKIIEILEEAGYRQAKIRKEQVRNAGYVVGYDERTRIIAISYEEPEGRKPVFTPEAMHQAYQAALQGTGYTMTVHGDDADCTIKPAHLHIKV